VSSFSLFGQHLVFIYTAFYIVMPQKKAAPQAKAAPKANAAPKAMAGTVFVAVLVLVTALLASPLFASSSLVDEGGGHSKPDEHVLLVALKKALSQTVENPPTLANMRDFGHHMGPVHIHCATLQHREKQGTEPAAPAQAAASAVEDDNAGIEDVLEYSFAGWAREGSHAALSLRSNTKMLVSAAFLSLAENPNNRLALDATVGSLLPACAARTNLLRDATLADLLSLRSPMDGRSYFMRSLKDREASHFASALFRAPGSNPCEIHGYSYLECANNFLCPIYDTAVVPSVSEMKNESLPAGFVLYPSEIVDNQWCVNAHPNCSMWAATGECINNPSYMLTKCAKACRACPSFGNSCEDIEGDPLCSADLKNRGAEPCRSSELSAADEEELVARCPRACGICDDMDDFHRKYIRKNFSQMMLWDDLINSPTPEHDQRLLLVKYTAE
jgi:hypothetical protein